jgi:SAM-dependent methyltransferase
MFEHSAHVYDVLYSFKDYATEAATLAALIRERRPEARSLLDVACGTGRHLEVLRETFPDVVGVDIDPGLLGVARRRLPNVPLIEADMRRVDVGRRFDVVTCLFSSVGYLADRDELARSVAAMADHLEPGGVLVVDGWVKQDAWRDGTNVDALSETADDVAAARLTRTWRVDDRCYLDMRYVVATLGGFEHFAEEHVLTLFSDADYRYAFNAAGLAPDVIDSPMGADRDRYIAVS